MQASHNKIGNIGDQVLLYCYHYDPRTGKYGAVVSNILKLAALATMLILGTFMFVMFRADRIMAAWQTGASYVTMSKFLPLWPDQASTMAGQVDALYIYLLLVSGVMTALIFISVTVLAIKYRRARSPRSPADRRLHDS